MQPLPATSACPLSLVAAPALPSSVRQRLVDPQHGHGSQRLVESYVQGQNESGQAAQHRAGRVSLRRMHSLSGQSFSSELPGASPSSTAASSTSCSSSTASAPACHVHPVYYHHTTSSYLLQTDSVPDLPPPDVTSGVRCRTESSGYFALSFLAASGVLGLRAAACSAALSPPAFLVPFCSFWAFRFIIYPHICVFSRSPLPVAPLNHPFPYLPTQWGHKPRRCRLSHGSQAPYPRHSVVTKLVFAWVVHP